MARIKHIWLMHINNNWLMMVGLMLINHISIFLIKHISLMHDELLQSSFRSWPINDISSHTHRINTSAQT
jgi:hypothetical protein